MAANNNVQKAYLRIQDEIQKELAKLDMNNPIMLLDKLPSYGYEQGQIFFAILTNLVELSVSKPDAFVHHPALFDAFNYILENYRFDQDEMVQAVITILKNISQTPEHKAILKDKFAREDPSIPKTNILRGLLVTSGVLPIFNMQEIMASEYPHVYAIQGHGCVYDKAPPIVVPKGVIWIEMTVCGLTALSSDIVKFINSETKSFLENTPIPTDEPSRQKYRADLGSLTDYGFGVKFPGQPIADGMNTLFFQAFAEGKPQNRFYKSGIERLYTKPLNIDDYNRVNGTVDEENESYTETLTKVYSESIYPTLDQIMRTKPNQTNYEIKFCDLFAGINSQEYIVTKPMILIQAGCRTPCDSVNAPALRKQNSIEGKTKMVSELPVRNLIRPGREEQTYLMSLINQGLFGQARLLMERVERELGLGELILYLSQQRILAKIRYEDEPIILEEMVVVPKDFKEFIQSKYDVSEIARMFNELRHLLHSGRPEMEWRLAFMKIGDLAEPHKEEFIAYEELFDTLLQILDKGLMQGTIRYLLWVLAKIPEDKARLAAKFQAIPAADGVRGESIAELRSMLQGHGVIAAGGTRKKKRSKRKSRRVNRKY
jgi:hypothetical protein